MLLKIWLKITEIDFHFGLCSAITRVGITWCKMPARTPMMNLLPYARWGNILGERHGDATTFDRIGIFQREIFHCILHERTCWWVYYYKIPNLKNFWPIVVLPPCVVSPSNLHPSSINSGSLAFDEIAWESPAWWSQSIYPPVNKFFERNLQFVGAQVSFSVGYICMCIADWMQSMSYRLPTSDLDCGDWGLHPFSVMKPNRWTWAKGLLWG